MTYAQEFRHTAIDTAQFCEQLTHRVIDDALHRRQEYSRGGFRYHGAAVYAVCPRRTAAPVAKNRKIVTLPRTLDYDSGGLRGKTMPSLIAQGAELLVYGMGTVVVFLTVLVYATRSMSWLVLRYAPEPIVETRPRRSIPSAEASSPSTSADQPTPAQLAAIAAALHLHRGA